MARFDDYHRTVVGYHGTGLRAALRIVNRVETFRWSRRDFDWLGHGVYFWEHAPEQALRFARIRQRQYQRKQNPSAEETRRATEPLAVVACMIRLGFCFDLLDPANVDFLLKVFADYRAMMSLTEEPLPRNTRKYRRLDCGVFEYAFQSIDETGLKASVDTTRGVYVPAGGNRRVWEGSWVSRDAHIQICVRNPASLLGSWLYHPKHLEARDVAKRSKISLSTSSARIRRAAREYHKIPKLRRIEMMVRAGLMTEEQAGRIRAKLAEIDAAEQSEAAASGPPVEGGPGGVEAAASVPQAG